MLLLLEHGVDIDQSTGYQSNRAIHIAVQRRDFALVKLLLERGASVTTVNAQGWTPLDKLVNLYKVSNNELKDIAQLLMEHGATLKNDEEYASILNQEKINILHEAQSNALVIIKTKKSIEGQILDFKAERVTKSSNENQPQVQYRHYNFVRIGVLAGFVGVGGYLIKACVNSNPALAALSIVTLSSCYLCYNNTYFRQQLSRLFTINWQEQVSQQTDLITQLSK